MLTMPSVSSASNLVTRPVLVAEVVRPAAPQRAIEPTTAVSKERSRAENKAPDTSTAAASALYTPSGKSKASERANGVNGTNGTSGANAEATRAAEEARNKEQPPAEKSEIQKAMEAQLKELLTNVWKASAKAVDFLLQRDSEAAGENAVTTLEPAALLGKKAGAAAGASDAPAKNTVVAYNAQGGRLSEETAAAGQLLDVLA
jgi:hypothetical protein